MRARVDPSAGGAVDHQSGGTAPFAGKREIFAACQDFAGYAQPIFREDGLQTGDGGSLDAADGVAPSGVAACTVVPLIGDPRAADERGLAIDHQQFAVGPVVDLRQQIETRRVIPLEPATGFGDGAKISAGSPQASQKVHNQLYLHAGSGTFGEGVDETAADFAFVEDKGFQVDALLSLRDGREFGFVEAVAVGEDFDLVPGVYLRVAQAGQQVAELGRIDRRCGSFLDAVRVIRSEKGQEQKQALDAERDNRKYQKRGVQASLWPGLSVLYFQILVDGLLVAFGLRRNRARFSGQIFIGLALGFLVRFV